MANLDALLTRIDLTDLAERAGAKFHRNGSREVRSACPLHSNSDNQTAFTIRQDGDRQVWYCFTGCNAGGDAVDFYSRWKGTDFPDTVQQLAEMYHVPLSDIGWNQPADRQAEIERRQRQDVFAIANEFFVMRLWSDQGEAARDYLHKRGFSDETIKALGWGYTHSNQSLLTYLRQHNADLQPAHKIGLVRADGADFTANADGAAAGPHGWIIFPHYLGARISYFSSRALEIEGHPRPDPDDKSRNLPGARQVYRCEAKGQDQVTLVEGPLDAASLYQAGKSSWALCGLGSLPADELARIKRRKAVYIATDSDDAGRQNLQAVDGKFPASITAIGPLAMILPAIQQGKDYNAWLQADNLMTGLDDHYSSAITWLETRLKQAAICPDREADIRMTELGALLASVPEAAQVRYYGMANKILHLTRAEINNLIKQAAQKDGYTLGSIRDGQLHFAGRPLLNGIIKIDRELIMDDGQDLPRVRFSVCGRLVGGQQLDALDIEAEEFDQFKWIARHWGRQAILYCSKGQYYELSRAIMETSTEAVRERVYTYTGWTQIDGKPAYLSATGAITTDGLNPNVRVDLGHNNLRHYAMPSPPTGPEMYDACQASMAFLDIGPRHVTAPIWAAMYAAPLTEIAPLYAVMWVYGQTQSGKSTIMHLALTHFGAGFVAGRQYHAPIDWTSTGTAIEGAMFTAKDVPLVIDDFAPQFASAADSREMHRKASITIRSVGNRSSRGRARADLTARKERIPRGMVISTAENPLMGQSIVGRMIYVPIGRGEVVPLDGKQNPALDQAQACAQRGLYAQAMAAYIQWLAANYERIAGSLPERINTAAAYARQKSPAIQGRLPDYFALLAVSQKLALECFLELGLITKIEMDRMHQDNTNAILGVVTQQAERIATESPIRKVFEALGALLARKQIYLAPRTGGRDYLPPDHSELVGWYGNKVDEQHLVYLDTRQALMSAKEYWQRLTENLDILPDAFLLQVRQIPDLIAKTGEVGRDEASEWIAGKTRRVLVINRTRCLDLFGIDLSNETNNPGLDPE